MSSGSRSPDQVLQDYFDTLLDDCGLDARSEFLDGPAPAVGAPAPTAISNIALLPTARPIRESQVEGMPPRPYAEPIRTLNLRVPLPPVAEPPLEPIASPPVVAPVDSPALVSIEVALAVEEKLTDEKLTTVEIASPKTERPADPVKDEFVSMSPPGDWLANGRPIWAQQPFECLLFRVGGLALAAPLIELGAIYPLEEDNLTSIFGQTSWFMGLLPVKEYNVRAIDTALVVMPERYEQPMRERYRFVISLYGADWGLAVDEVMNSVRLDPDQVRWRGQRSKRPWLAGTVVDQMCALLDIGQLAWMFHNQDRKRRL